MHTRGKPLADGVRLGEVARQTSGLTGADLANICNEAAISAGRRERDQIVQADFDYALERVVAGLQQRKLITDKEKRVIAYHEAGHALVARLMGDAMQLHKVTIVARGQALGYTMNLPEEDRYLQSTEELRDWLKVILAGRAAEQVVFGRITNGAANDLERATAIARAMVFEWGMGESMPHQQVRADNYALSEETKRMRDAEQRGITDAAYRDALRLVEHHREYLDRLAHALLATETLERPEIDRLLEGLEPESNSSLDIGVEAVLAVRPPAAACLARLAWRRCRWPPLAARPRAGSAVVGRHLLGRALDRIDDGAVSAEPSLFTAAISCSFAAICARMSAIFAAAPASSPDRSASAFAWCRL